MPWYYGSSFMWLMPLTMLLFWGGLIVVVALVLRHFRTFRTGIPRQPDTERILGERLARGEIDENEYTRLRDLLRTRS